MENKYFSMCYYMFFQIEKENENADYLRISFGNHDYEELENLN